MDVLGVSIYDYPLVPADERTAVVAMLDSAMRKRMDVVSSNHAEWKPNGEPHRVLMRWHNAPVFDGGKVIAVRGTGHIIGGGA